MRYTMGAMCCQPISPTTKTNKGEQRSALPRTRAKDVLNAKRPRRASGLAQSMFRFACVDQCVVPTHIKRNRHPIHPVRISQTTSTAQSHFPYRYSMINMLSITMSRRVIVTVGPDIPEASIRCLPGLSILVSFINGVLSNSPRIYVF